MTEHGQRSQSFSTETASAMARRNSASRSRGGILFRSFVRWFPAHVPRSKKRRLNFVLGDLELRVSGDFEYEVRRVP